MPTKTSDGYEIYHNKWNMPYILMPCIVCGKVRSARLKDGKPIDIRCTTCASKDPARGAKISRALKGKPKSESHKKNMKNCFAKGHIPWHKGKVGCYSEELRKRLSETMKSRGIRPSPEAIIKSKKVNSERERSLEYRQRLSKLWTGRLNPPEVRAKMSEAHKGIPLSKEHRESMSRTWKKKFEDVEFSTHRIKLLRGGAYTRPTKPETLLEKILQRTCPNEYKYTGNGEFMIGRKFPDFVNVNGKKKVIELFGDYWHKNENPQEKINVYADYGFDCLVIWERELKQEEVVMARIREFNDG